MKIGIIGSGVGGLSIAIRLASKGHSVTVFEKNHYPGGKLSQIQSNGFRFDAGPSLFTLPNLLEDVLRLSPDYDNKFKYKKLDTVCKYFYNQSEPINAFSNINDFAAECERKTNTKAFQIIKYLKTAEELYLQTSNVFIFNSFHKWKNFLTEPYKKVAKHLHKMDFFNSLHHRNKKSFSDPRIVQIFDRFATYNGSNPYKAPATLKIISHLEHNIGAYFPEKGMNSITEALVSAASKLNVSFLFNHQVNEIITDVKNKRVVGVRSNGESFLFDALVCDADVGHLYRDLMPKGFKSHYSLKQPKSTSALIFYWGIQGTYPDLDVHNILFSENYKLEFDHLFHLKKLPADPTIYIFISSKMVASDAPLNCENWFVMMNAPENVGQDWEFLIKQAKQEILRKINSVLKIDLSDKILCEHINDPRSIEKNTHSVNGALYGPASNNLMSAFWRHPNFSNRFKNLFFVGGSVHPGGGIPLALASAKIVDDEFNSAIL